MIEFTLYDANGSGNVKNTVYPTAVRISDTAVLRKATSLDHVCAKYRDNRRSEANFEYADCIMMDCDNDHSEVPADWKTPEAVAAAFPNVCFGVSYSRNHMKEKNGRAPRPKFHVYFPIKQVSDPKRYVTMKRQILERFPWFDHNAADAARFFLGADNGERCRSGGRKHHDRCSFAGDHPGRQPECDSVAEGIKAHKAIRHYSRSTCTVHG